MATKIEFFAQILLKQFLAVYDLQVGLFLLISIICGVFSSKTICIIQANILMPSFLQNIICKNFFVTYTDFVIEFTCRIAAYIYHLPSRLQEHEIRSMVAQTNPFLQYHTLHLQHRDD